MKFYRNCPIFRGKCRAQKSIKVRGDDEGGHLWKLWASERHVETELMDQVQDTTRCTLATSRDVQASLEALSLSDVDVAEFHTFEQSSVENSERSYYSINNENKGTSYSAASFSGYGDPETDERPPDKQTGMIDASRKQLVHERIPFHSSEARQTEQYKVDTRCTHENSSLIHSQRVIANRRLRSKESPISTGTSFNTNYASRRCESDMPTRSLSAQKVMASEIVAARKKTVHLKPLDVGFADDPRVPTEYDGESLGKQLDGFCTQYPTMALPGHEYSLKVFKYEEEYYSTDSSTLWILQVLERFTGNARITGTLVPRPPHIPINGLYHSFRSTIRLSGGKWKRLSTLNDLSTKRTLGLCLSDIFYTRNAISDTFKGLSIAKRLVEVFTGGTRNHELNVMEFKNQYYTLENRKLWILKHAEKALENFNITGNVKLSMDYLLFDNFTTKNIRNVDINLTHDMHTDEERFILQYILNS
ncbi:uncharacterized protein LOC130053218 isoform X1 [Ostrea edulis]|uniref:uncharacterized protein LOC130053218 isoform X1 n=1 Tax=Ostrea edulis TaxID=37623 RepID=UPI0024AF193D|nr:uncharacterized protein LOC130053218 isoform X1 [Ostrea edulis]XP_056015976.1 uncharacterized protein LOC130053218 isoform X1 [Ostrea edulis]XP_056015977.1 uncharacterized protein LOC130053218 isoform X1 [Ostrea edulis]